MRVLLLAVLTLIGAFAPAAPRAAEDDGRVVDKLVLKHWSPNLLIKETLREGVVPPGVDGILGYPKDSSLLIRGTAEGVTNLKRALRVIDVPGAEIEHGDTTVTIRPDRADAGDLRELMLALPQPGSVTLQEGALTLKGRAAWVRRGLALTARLDLAGK